MIKRFALFGGHNYYPSGGWEDHLNSFDALDEAKAAADAYAKSISWNIDWWHIVDLSTMEIVERSK